MAKQFKVKYKERAALARALQREVKTLGLVDTWSMHDGIRIAASSGMNLNGITITVVAPYYYLFQDEGAKLWNGGRIPAQHITDKWIAQSKVQNIIATIAEQYIQWRIENFPIFAVAQIRDNPKVRVGFSFFGDPSGKWNIDVAPPSF
jgi:hypothetical protein